MSQVTSAVAWPTAMWSVMVAASPTMAVRVSTSPVEAAAVVGTAAPAKAVFGAARAPPVGLLDASAAVGAWKAFLLEWAENPLVQGSGGEFRS